MKDITKMLRKGNLAPKERVLLVIRNDAHFQKTGKELISEADMVALTINWKPQDYREAEKYNQYINLWEMFQRLEFDMQTNYLTTMLALSRLEHTATLFDLKKNDERQWKYYLDRIIPDDQREELHQFFLHYSGYEYDRLAHLIALHSLPKDIRSDILLLDSIADTDHSYLLAEEQLARIVHGKKSLTDEDVHTLTKIIIEKIPWGHELSLHDTKISIKQVLFNTHFAGYSMLEFGKRLASRDNITYEDEDDLRTKLGVLSDLRYKLEQVVRDTVRDGLFFSEYIPLCHCTGHTTYEGETKLPHNELMQLWIKAKDKSERKLKTLIKNGKIQTEQCPTRFFEVSLNKSYISGKSLVKSKSQSAFVTEYEKQVDDLILFAFPNYLLHQSHVYENYQYLLAFKEVAERMSEMIGVDVTYKINAQLAEIDKSVELLNFSFRHLDDHINQMVYDNRDKYPLQIFLPDPGIELHNLEPKQFKSLERFEEEASKLTEWKTTASD